jgi:hypothetical protein
MEMEIIAFLIVMAALLAFVFISIGIIIGKELNIDDDINRNNGGRYIGNTNIGKRHIDMGNDHK